MGSNSGPSQNLPNQKQLVGFVDISNQYSSFVHFPVMNVQFSAKRKKLLGMCMWKWKKNVQKRWEGGFLVISYSSFFSPCLLLTTCKLHIVWGFMVPVVFTKVGIYVTRSLLSLTQYHIFFNVSLGLLVIVTNCLSLFCCFHRPQCTYFAFNFCSICYGCVEVLTNSLFV